MTTTEWALMMFVITGTFGIVARAFVFVRHRNQVLRDVWAAFAQRHGFRFTEETGPWYRRRGPVITGAMEGVEFRLERDVVRRGKHSIVFTRVRGELGQPTEKKLVVCPRDLSHRLRYGFGPATVATGSPTFDTRMMLLSDSRDDALEIIGSDVRAQLLAFKRRTQIECEGGEASLAWRTGEHDPTVLEAGCKLLAALCRPRSTLTSSAARATARGL